MKKKFVTLCLFTLIIYFAPYSQLYANNYRGQSQVSEFVEYAFEQGSEGKSGDQYRSRMDDLCVGGGSHGFWLHPIGVYKEGDLKIITGQLSHIRKAKDEQIYFIFKLRDKNLVEYRQTMTSGGALASVENRLNNFIRKLTLGQFDTQGVLTLMYGDEAGMAYREATKRISAGNEGWSESAKYILEMILTIGSEK